jgi:hypothetical protein
VVLPGGARVFVSFAADLRRGYGVDQATNYWHLVTMFGLLPRAGAQNELCVAWIVVVQKTILIPSVTNWSSGIIVSNKGTMGTTAAARSQITSSVAKGTARISRTTS